MPPPHTAAGTPLRRRMIEDMTLAKLAAGTRQAYVGAMRSLAARRARTESQVIDFIDIKT